MYAFCRTLAGRRAGYVILEQCLLLGVLILFFFALVCMFKLPIYPIWRGCAFDSLLLYTGEYIRFLWHMCLWICSFCATVSRLLHVCHS